MILSKEQIENLKKYNCPLEAIVCGNINDLLQTVEAYGEILDKIIAGNQYAYLRAKRLRNSVSPKG